MELDWISAQEAADKWNITLRQVQSLCLHGKIEGVKRLGKIWLIPKEAERPVDGRTLAGKEQKREANKK